MLSAGLVGSNLSTGFGGLPCDDGVAAITASAVAGGVGIGVSGGITAVVVAV